LAHPVHCSWTDRPVSGQRPLYVFPVRWNHFISCRRHYRLAVIDEADSKPAAVAQWGWMRAQRVDISFSLARRRCTSTKTPCAAHIGNVNLPIQLTQCRFPGLAISNAKILIYFSNKIHRSNFIKQHSETVMVWNYRKCWLQFKKKYCVIYYNFWYTFVPSEWPVGSTHHKQVSTQTLLVCCSHNAKMDTVYSYCTIQKSSS